MTTTSYPPDTHDNERVVVVAGGPGGLGASICRQLAATGASVAVGYWVQNPPAAAEELVAELSTTSGQRHVSVPLDIRNPNSCLDFVAEVANRLGRIDIVVNSAGINTPEPSLEVSESRWDDIVDTDLKGAFFLSQAAARQMIEQGGHGPADAHYSITHITSQLGLVGLGGRAAYCASKAGLINLSRVLAIEWAQHGIRVNTVAPTVIETPLTSALLTQRDYRNDILARSPMAQIGTPDDVAAGVVYLASRQARLVTGHTLTIDGGWTAW